MAETKRHTLRNIQMMRAIAALSVLLHHALPHYKAMGGTSPTIMFLGKWGFVGVDIFFVISGYIMAYTTFDKERSWNNAKRFLKHRFVRIYSGYWPFFFVMIALLYVTDPKRLESLNLWGSLLLTEADMFKLVLPVSWSLTYELYFYLLFFFTFFIPFRFLYSLLSVGIAMFAFAAVYLYLTIPEQYTTSTQTFFYSPFLLEFFGGVLLFMYRKKLMLPLMIPIVVPIIYFSYAYGIEHDAMNGMPRILSFGTGALGLILLTLLLEYHRIFTAKGTIVAIGNASYALYLSHLILIGFFSIFGLRKLFTSQEYALLPLLGLVFLIAICVNFSLVYYARIEKPLYRKLISFGETR